LFVRTNRNDDFVRRKRRKSVANGETDIRLTSRSIDGLARQLLGRAFGDPLRMTERFLVVGEPVERALPYNRHHDLDGFGVPNMPAQNVVGMFDGADDEDVPAHAWKRTAEDSPPTARRNARCPIRAQTAWPPVSRDVISIKTASVHVFHILRKLDVPNRREAAAIVHRLAPPQAT
jgi:hypothetical protein